MTEERSARKKFPFLPIYSYEYRKFIPFALINFITVFNYTLLRNMKDALIITAPESGAEVIPFLKFWGVLPSAVLFSLLYAKIRQWVGFKWCYCIIILFFIVFYAAFPLCIYPHHDVLLPDPMFVKHLKHVYPNFQWLFAVWGAWTYGLYYMVSELWSVLAISILFWQFANYYTLPEEAKRFYPVFAFSGNIAPILLALFINIVLGKELAEAAHARNIKHLVDFTSIVIILGAVLIIFLLFWISRYGLNEPSNVEAEGDKKIVKGKKKRLSLLKSLKEVVASSYIRNIALIVFAYNVIINLIEITWKDKLLKLHPSTEAYFAYLNKYTLVSGIIISIVTLCTRHIVRRYGWFSGAIITPLVVLITGGLFFMLVLFEDTFQPLINYFNLSFLSCCVFIGALGLILSKGMKYSVFDTTKEIAFIPLEREVQSTAKAAVDGVGSRFGKSIGGVIQQALLLITGGVQADIVGPVAIIVFLLGAGWIFSVRKLSHAFDSLTKA